MNPIAKGLIISGLLLVLLGILWHYGGKYLPLGRLPGDILIKKNGFHFYFPLMSCILVSLLLTLVGLLIRYFKK